MIVGWSSSTGGGRLAVDATSAFVALAESSGTGVGCTGRLLDAVSLIDRWQPPAPCADVLALESFYHDSGSSATRTPSGESPVEKNTRNFAESYCTFTAAERQSGRLFPSPFERGPGERKVGGNRLISGIFSSETLFALAPTPLSAAKGRFPQREAIIRPGQAGIGGPVCPVFVH